ncbi:MAG: TonB-dependent receptor, partial [Flavobacteriaceae bacterium]|nr:TonB-dependent receptor [Flavobacteriaceae bacterium]
ETLGLQSSSKSLMRPFQEIDNHILSLKNTFFFENSSLEVNLGYLFNDRREFEEELNGILQEDVAALRLKLKTFNYDIKYTLPKLGRFETIIGLQGMFQDNKNFGEEILIPNATTKDVGILATTHYHLDKIDFQAGVRFDNRTIKSEQYGLEGEEGYIKAIDRNFNSFNIAFGFKTKLFKEIITRLNLASGFRAPNLSELSSNGIHVGTNRFEIGNSGLDNEKNFQIDLAFEYKKEHFEVFVNGFYNRINQFIFIKPKGEFINEYPVFDYVQGDAKLYGGEVGFHIHPHPIDWLHIESTFETVIGKQDNNDLPLIPANKWQNTFRIEFEKINFIKKPHAFIKLKSTFRQDRVSDFETRSPGYSLLSAGFGGGFKIQKTQVNFTFNASNLTNKRYIAHLSRLKNQNLANIGRNFSLNLKVKI